MTEVTSSIISKKAVILLSGGLDSATAAAQAIADGYEAIALSFRYGQRHERELLAARQVADALKIKEHFVVDGGGSALTDTNIDVPTEGIQAGEIPITYVPGRNTVFIAIALSLAESKGAEAIYLGINAVDYSGYPDCRPDYLQAFQKLAALSSKVGVEGHAPQLIAPLVMDSKIDIVRCQLSLHGHAIKVVKFPVGFVILVELGIRLFLKRIYLSSASRYLDRS